MWRYLRALAQAALGSQVEIAGARVSIPGPLKIRLSVVASNIRLHRLIDTAVAPGATAVDVGANTGYNTVYLARRVGASGCVVAIEPARDNVRVLRSNVAANGLANVVVHAAAAGRAREVRDLFLRGDTSAVNSLFEKSVYAEVTGVEKVAVAPLAGMTRLLSNPGITVIVEWHPRLQEAAGHPADALPRFLLRDGFTLRAASHTRVTPLGAHDIDRLCARLHRSGRPVEIVAVR